MKSKSFKYLWIGQSFADVGDVLYIVALISLLYSSTGSPFYLAFLPFAITFARFISGIFAPILINRLKLKSLLVSSQVIKTVLLLLLSLYVYIQIEAMSPFIVITFAFTISFFDGWANPARDAMLPRLVSSKELVRANSFLASVDQIIQLGGWAFGGILVAAISGSYVIWLTLLLYFVSTLMMFGIIDETQHEISKGKEEAFWYVLKEGWAIIWRNPSLRNIHVMLFIESIAHVVWIAAILYVFVYEVLQESEKWWGYINVSFFVGLLIGGVVGMKFSTMIEKHMTKTIIMTSFVVSIIPFLFGANSNAWIALIISAMFGLFEQIKGISLQTGIQQSTSADMLPKVYAAQSALTAITFGLSTLFFGYISEQYNIRIVFILAGILLVMSAMYALKNKNSLEVKKVA
ncbi:MFS transporter [Cytobacillus sp. Hm23]